MRSLFQWLALPLVIALMGTAIAKPNPAAEPVPEPKGTVDFMRLQVFLDNANFGPGIIDGEAGEFTQKALALYRESKGQRAAVDRARAIDLSGIDLSSADPALIEYEVTDDDAASVGELPKEPAAQAKMKRLPYASLAEAVAEKFHTSIDCLTKLNPGNTGRLKAGDKIMVPNVKPFVLNEVKRLVAGSEAPLVIANEFEGEPPSAAATSAGEPDAMSVHISTTRNMLEVRVGEKLSAAFPVTVGSDQTESPAGQWTVRGLAKMPTFRYDLSMLNKGERSSHFHLLPSGPNNPVGVIWIALNKKGIGIHGTNSPETIGRASSHGCIRLANWDAVKVAELIKPGVAVSIK